MSGRLLIGILCFLLGLVLIAAGRGVRHQTRQVEVKEKVHWLTAKIESIESVQKVYPKATSGRSFFLAHYYYEADLSFVTEDGKTIKVRKPIPDYALRIDKPLTIHYREDDPRQTSDPLPEGLDSHGNKVDNDSKAAETENIKDDGKEGGTGLTVIGLCLAFLGGAMVYAAFKS